MNENKLIIQYRSLPNVERSSTGAMVNYLDREEAAWAPFLAKLAGEQDRVHIQYYHRPITAQNLSQAFALLRNALNDTAKFRSVNGETHRRGTVVPPPSGSVEGRLILGLHDADRWDDALAAFVRFVLLELSTPQPRTGSDATTSLSQRGDTLLAAAHAAAALPAQKLAAAGVKAAQRESEKGLAAIDRTIDQAEKTQSDHRELLAGIREALKARATRLRRLFLHAERQRELNYRTWREAIDAEVTGRFKEAEARIVALDKVAEQKHLAREKEFDDLKALFHTQLRLRAPVALWETRAGQHRDRATIAMQYFWLSALCAVVVGLLVPFLLGDYIAASFHTVACLTDQPRTCSRQFSAKGPLTVAGILLTTSVILWITKLQYRIFLSERHLSLDAEEKKAFAETFMALKEDTTVDVANETIVLASLFRPTQDGIIKDEDGGFDLSAAAVLAKHMAK